MSDKTIHRQQIGFIHFLLAILASNIALSAFAAQGCTISEPRNGGQVAREASVSGTANLAPSEYAWLVARRFDFAPNWWPQGRYLDVDARTGEWRGTAVFGGPQDVGWEFDVAVMIVTSEGNQRLLNYREKAIETGDWRPIRIQDLVKGKSPCAVKVRKTGH